MKNFNKMIAISLIMTLIVGLFPSCSIGSVVDSIIPNNKGMEHALKEHDLELVKEAVEAGADVNRNLTIFSGPTASPLWYSIRNGQRFIPAYLLSKGADPNFVDDQGISILMFTVGAPAQGITYQNAEDNESYKTLLNDKRTKINLKSKLGFTALDYACSGGEDLETINYLINHGAKITVTTMKCAIDAFSQGSYDPQVLKLILDSLIKQGIPSGLDPEIEAAILGDSNKLILLYNTGKIKQQNMKMVQFLAAAFCDVNALKTLTSKGTDLNAFFHFDNNTLLSTASKYGKLETVEYLVSQNVNIDAVHSEEYCDETALTKAISYDRLDIAKYLHKSGAKFQNFENISGDAVNVLELACANGNIDMVKWILDSGYPLTTFQEVGAMTKAAEYDRIDVLKYLINVKKFDINAEIYDDTVLEGATNFASLETIKFLVDNGANVNGGKIQFSPPLTAAVMCNRLDVAKYLIGKGADLDLAGTSCEGYKNSSPLTLAIQNGYFDMVKLLIDNGASVNYNESWSEGDTSMLAIAKAEGSKKIIAYIEAAKKK